MRRSSAGIPDALPSPEFNNNTPNNPFPDEFLGKDGESEAEEKSPMKQTRKSPRVDV